MWESINFIAEFRTQEAFQRFFLDTYNHCEWLLIWKGCKSYGKDDKVVKRKQNLQKTVDYSYKVEENSVF